MEAKVPCVRFGLPPDKNKPHPRFPGVSASFDPASALQVYTDVLKKEKETLADGLLLEEKLDTAKRKTKMGLLDPVATQKNMDILPGYGSLTDFCQNFGFLRHPVSGRFVPHDECGSQLPCPSWPASKEHSQVSQASPGSSVSVALRRPTLSKLGCEALISCRSSPVLANSVSLGQPERWDRRQRLEQMLQSADGEWPRLPRGRPSHRPRSAWR
ncbi:unnamed protein product [Effrenium voratum]|uniref:Uncharacterized protein n=1 Tax=Effrenium voratum TaxID=2562239 RepID=A0AA36MLC0_9DINO|nr:unnamed protein product [Effrenium voratum]